MRTLVALGGGQGEERGRGIGHRGRHRLLQATKALATVRKLASSAASPSGATPAARRLPGGRRTETVRVRSFGKRGAVRTQLRHRMPFERHRSGHRPSGSGERCVRSPSGNGERCVRERPYAVTSSAAVTDPGRYGPLGKEHREDHGTLAIRVQASGVSLRRVLSN